MKTLKGDEYGIVKGYSDHFAIIENDRAIEFNKEGVLRIRGSVYGSILDLDPALPDYNAVRHALRGKSDLSSEMQRRLEVMSHPLSADEAMQLKKYLAPMEFMTYTLPNVNNEKRVGFISGGSRNIVRFARNGDIEDQRYDGFNPKQFLKDKDRPETFTSFIATLRGERMGRTFVSIEVLRNRQAQAQASSAAALNGSASAFPPAASSSDVAPSAPQPLPAPTATAAPAITASSASSASAAAFTPAPSQQPVRDFVTLTKEERDLYIPKILSKEFFCYKVDGQMLVAANDGQTFSLSSDPAKADELQANGWQETNVSSLASRMPIVEADALAKKLQANEYTITVDTAFSKGVLGPGLMALFYNHQGNTGCLDFDLTGKVVQFDHRMDGL